MDKSIFYVVYGLWFIIQKKKSKMDPTTGRVILSIFPAISISQAENKLL